MTRNQEIKKQTILSVAHRDFEKGLNLYAFYKVSNRATSEDLVQDTFVKTWSYLARGGKIEVMGAFLYHILNNLIVDEYRKHKTTSLDILFSKGFDPSAVSSGRLLDAIDGKEAILMIAHLPGTYQKVMRMRYVEDLSLMEMSRATGQSRNALAVQLHRGLEKLKILYHCK